MLRLLPLVLAAPLLLAAPGRAGMILGDAYRSVQSGGDAAVFDPETGDPIDSAADGGLTSTGAYGLFDDDEGVGVSVAGAGVNGIASQTSDIAEALVTAFVAADVNAGVAGQGCSASGFSQAQFQLAFELASAEVWRFTTSASAIDSGTAWMALYRGVDSVFDYSSDWGVPIEQEVRLGAGSYVLSANAEASGSAVDFGTSGGLSELTFRFELVPEPGSAALAAASGAALALLRRRQSLLRAP